MKLTVKQTLLTITIIKMGNLQMSNPSRSPFKRKPIFNHGYSPTRSQNTRSLSPYILKASRSMMNRSNIIGGQKNSRGRFTNRDYLNPLMVKSIIKDSRTQMNNVDRQSAIRLRKSIIPAHSQRNSLIMSRSTFLKESQGTKQKINYTQKQFQQLSPRKQKDYKCQNIKDFTVSPIKKCSGNVNILKSNQSIGQSWGKDGHMIQSTHCHCCFHNYHPSFSHQPILPTFTISQKEKSNLEQLTDNAPTERKKGPQLPIFKFNHSVLRQSQNRNAILKTEQVGSFHLSDSDQHTQNHNKCQQIIKRVRNFNQFLNEIKKKVKKQYETFHSSNGNTFEHTSMSQNDQTSSMNEHTVSISVDHPHNSSLGTENQERKTSKGNKSITLALTLENEKIQLQKYRKMVQRQLSKQHSIESIQIESKNKEKIIRINFEKDESKKNEEEQKKMQQNGEEKKRMKRIKIGLGKKQQKAKDPTRSKGKGKGGKEQGKGNQGQQYQRVKIGKRMNKINTLFNKMQSINKQQIDSYRQLTHILHQKDTSLEAEDG